MLIVYAIPLIPVVAQKNLSGIVEIEAAPKQTAILGERSIR